MLSAEVQIQRIYGRLLDHFGPQNWWPAESPFEVVVGAVLTQNTAWRNVEQAIRNLKDGGRFDLEGVLAMSDAELAEKIRPSGFYRIKTRRLRAVLEFLKGKGGTEQSASEEAEAAAFRRELLQVHGVGPETADCILLYALGVPSFVIDAYTRRIFSRLGVLDPAADYETLRGTFQEALPVESQVYNEYHALIVALAKGFCRARKPLCERCPLRPDCPAGCAAAPPEIRH